MASVAVIMPVRNHEAQVGQAIRSVLEQTHRDLELVVVDDASTDGSAAVAEGMAREDARVRVLRLPARRGGSAARNVGITRTSAPLVAFHDSDDTSLPHRLERQLAVLAAEPEAGLTYSAMLRVRGKRTSPWASPDFQPGTPDLFARALALDVRGIGIGTCVVRRDVFDRAGRFHETLPGWADLEWFIRAARVTRFAYVPEPLYRWTCTPGSTSTDTRALIAVDEWLLEAYAEELKERPAARAAHYRLLLRARLAHGDVAGARREVARLREAGAAPGKDALRVAWARASPGTYEAARKVWKWAKVTV
ncbi:MAG: glycosyltransferase family 2 protein [Halobacteriales archaeon]|nr:glycosyltransferase family 2 protein [Halobacteriales archaeon]